MLQAMVKVFPQRVTSDIDPWVFGNFIEFTHDCINEGMWAELLLNRGFEDRAGEALIAERWRETGYNDTGLYALEADTPFGHGWSQRIQNVHHFGGYKGIAQEGLLLQKDTPYRLSLWAKATGAKAMRVQLVNDSGDAFWQHSFAITETWARYELSGILPGACRHAALEVLLEAEGTLWVDQCSLMPETAIGGIWESVYEATAASCPTLLRFPGGCFADCYYWREGVGPRDARPARKNAHWGGMEENNFGTDEFIQLCRNLGCEPMICINFGSADEAEAAAWVEYCNGDNTTPMGRIRAENGHPEPYHVKLWGIGNETWAEWEIGKLAASDYGARYALFSQAMRAASPIPLALIACGGDGNSLDQSWNRRVLQDIGTDTEYLDFHCYAPQLYEQPATSAQIYDATVYAGHKYETLLQETSAIIREMGLATKLMVGEYNAMYYNNSNREHTLETALLNAGFLNAFLRNADMMRIGVFSDLVNGWQGGMIRSSRGSCYGTPSYYALKLFAEAGLSHSIALEVESATMDVEGVGHVPPMQTLPVLDAAAALNAEDAPCLFLVNRDPERPMQIYLDAAGYTPRELRSITGEYPYSKNDFGREEVVIRTCVPEEESTLILPPHSICLVILGKEGEAS